jgi:nucleotide-binding universal stress UspA family protein
MKNLLVPTDFSVCADDAMDAAAQLALRFEAKLHLLHFLKIPKGWAQPKEKTRAENEATKALRERAENFTDIEVTHALRTGKTLHEQVSLYVEEHGIDLIVIGSHGASGKNEFFIGSNTQRVVRTVNCSTMVIKDRLPEVDFNKVVFASSFNENEREPFLKFKEFVKHFIPEIHLVAISTSSLFDPPYTVTKEAMEDFKALSQPFSCKIHIFKNFSIDRGIRTFSDEIGAQLIGISNRHRHPLKRMLIGSNVEALINHSDIPVLTIDYAGEDH